MKKHLRRRKNNNCFIVRVAHLPLVFLVLPFIQSFTMCGFREPMCDSRPSMLGFREPMRDSRPSMLGFRDSMRDSRSSMLGFRDPMRETFLSMLESTLSTCVPQKKRLYT